jgi:hypothetical protein
MFGGHGWHTSGSIGIAVTNMEKHPGAPGLGTPGGGYPTSLRHIAVFGSQVTEPEDFEI